MPMTGRPSNIRSLKPSALIQERCENPSRSFLPNQLWLRSGGVDTAFSYLSGLVLVLADSVVSTTTSWASKMTSRNRVAVSTVFDSGIRVVREEL